MAKRAATTAKRKKIAAAVLAGKRPVEIAEEFGVTRQTMNGQIQHPETQNLIRDFLAPHHKRLQAIVDKSVFAVERALVSDHEGRAERIAWLRERIAGLRQVIAERAKEGEVGQYADVPGMRSGLVVHRRKSIGSGMDQEVVDEYEVDAGTLKELRGHEEQLKSELNDFTVNLKAVERAKDLLELAEGRRSDGSDSAPRRFAGEFADLLGDYRRISLTLEVGEGQTQTTRTIDVTRQE